MTGDAETGQRARTSAVSAIHKRLQLPLPWAGLALVLVAVAAFSLTIVNGQPLLRAVVNAAVAGLAVAVVLLLMGPVVGSRSLAVAVHAVLGLIMAATGSLVALLLSAEGALAVSPDTVIVGGILPVGLLVLLAGGLLAQGTTGRLRKVAAVGLVVTAAWGLVAVAIVVAITVGLGDPTPEVTEEAVGLWALFLSFVCLPSYVFWLDWEGSRR